MGHQGGSDVAPQFSSRRGWSLTVQIGVLGLQRPRPLGLRMSLPPYSFFRLEKAASLMPCLRHRSEVFVPSSCSFSTPIICSSVNCLRFIVWSFSQGPDSSSTRIERRRQRQWERVAACTRIAGPSPPLSDQALLGAYQPEDPEHLRRSDPPHAAFAPDRGLRRRYNWENNLRRVDGPPLLDPGIEPVYCRLRHRLKHRAGALVKQSCGPFRRPRNRSRKPATIRLLTISDVCLALRNQLHENGSGRSLKL